MAKRKSKSVQVEDQPHQVENVYESLLCAIVSAYTRCCGIVEERFLFDQYNALVGEPVTWESFTKLLSTVTGGPGYAENPCIWHHKGVMYLVSSGISDGGYLWCKWLDAKHGLYSNEEEYEQAMADVYDRRQEELLRDIESARASIIKDQQNNGLTPKILAREEITLWYREDGLSVPEIQYTKDYILGLRRRYKRDISCSEWNLKHALRQTSYSISDCGPIEEIFLEPYADYCLTYGDILDYSPEEKNKTKDLLWDAAQTLPIWRLNGHSVREVSNNETDLLIEVSYT